MLLQCKSLASQLITANNTTLQETTRPIVTTLVENQFKQAEYLAAHVGQHKPSAGSVAFFTVPGYLPWGRVTGNAAASAVSTVTNVPEPGRSTKGALDCFKAGKKCLDAKATGGICQHIIAVIGTVPKDSARTYLDA